VFCHRCRSTLVVETLNSVKCMECGAVFARRRVRVVEPKPESPMPRWLRDKVALRRAVEAIRVS